MLACPLWKNQTMCDNRTGRSQGVNDTNDNEIVIWDSENFVFKLHYECKICFLSVYLMGNNCTLAVCNLFDFRDGSNSTAWCNE